MCCGLLMLYILVGTYGVLAIVWAHMVCAHICVLVWAHMVCAHIWCARVEIGRAHV